jgi:HEAT repeat protein
MERLGRLKDPRAIDTLADVVARGSYEAEFAIQMLKRFGPAAETAGLELLQHRHVQTRRMACLLLGEVGTSRSLDPLREQMLDLDNQIAQTATEALRAVRQRASPEPL